MNNLHITCENLEQRQDVFNSLDKMGLVPVGSHGDFLQVNAGMKKGERRYMTVVEGDIWPDSKILTYSQFMDKYSMNQLKTKIDEVKEKLGLTQMQLSERIGKNPYYLDTVKHRGVTTERQDELIRELDLVANGGKVMTEREVIAELTEKADSLQEKLSKAQSANKEICHKLRIAKNEYNELNAAYGRSCEKICALSEIAIRYKRKYRDLFAAVVVTVIIMILGFVLWSVV